MRTRFGNSLSFRLVLSAMAVAAVLLLLAGGMLAWLFKSTVERNFDARLEATMNGLLANVDISERDELYLRTPLADPNFSLPVSGWYWQITPLKDGAARPLASSSLLEQRLPLPAEDTAGRDATGMARYYARDFSGNALRVLEKRFILFDGRHPVSVLVAGNVDELRAEITFFNHSMILMLGLFALALVLALFVQVRFGLRPLARLRGELSEIREGRKEALSGEYPREIAPVAHELNQLLHANREVIERARTQVGNLAHALKTPLAVLANEAASVRSALGRKVLEQIRIMRDHVELYLDRARRAATAGTLTAATEVRPVMEALTRTLLRINRDRNIEVEVSCPGGLMFRGEKQDLEEMLGNLLENAFRFAKRRIVIAAEPLPVGGEERGMFRLTIADDGPGLSGKERRMALQRGRRLDESTPGSGLGLSIVSEIAAMYHGELKLGRAAAAGLEAVLLLPRVTRGAK